jgi:hypothetical protein
MRKTYMAMMSLGQLVSTVLTLWITVIGSIPLHFGPSEFYDAPIAGAVNTDLRPVARVLAKHAVEVGAQLAPAWLCNVCPLDHGCRSQCPDASRQANSECAAWRARPRGYAPWPESQSKAERRYRCNKHANTLLQQGTRDAKLTPY